jgi:hypothetical protein
MSRMESPASRQLSSEVVLPMACTTMVTVPASGSEDLMWACGAAGSALPWHGRGHRFDPDQVHQNVETAAQAAADSAQAALLHAQSILHAERPWVLITVVPSPSIENGFTVMATNRGRGPARIVAMAQETRIAIDEAHLPGIPEFKPVDEELPPVSIILLPGEMNTIKSFCRDDVKGLCASEDRLQRIENWEERIFLYGNVVYKDLLAPIQEAPPSNRLVLPLHPRTPEERHGDGGNPGIQSAHLAHQAQISAAWGPSLRL